MIAIPSLELGRPAASAGQDDPVAVAREYARCGFRRLHVVDRRPDAVAWADRMTLRDVLVEHGGDVQVDAGCGDTGTMRDVLAEGARFVLVDSRVIDDVDGVVELTSLFPGEVILRADVRDRLLKLRRGRREIERSLLDVAEEVAGLPLAGLLVNTTDARPRPRPELALLEDVADVAGIPVLASGAITTLADLRELEACGVAAAVIGAALRDGALNPWLVADEFAA